MNLEGFTKTRQAAPSKPEADAVQVPILAGGTNADRAREAKVFLSLVVRPCVGADAGNRIPLLGERRNGSGRIFCTLLSTTLSDIPNCYLKSNQYLVSGYAIAASHCLPGPAFSQKPTHSIGIAQTDTNSALVEAGYSVRDIFIHS